MFNFGLIPLYICNITITLNMINTIIYIVKNLDVEKRDLTPRLLLKKRKFKK